MTGFAGQNEDSQVGCVFFKFEIFGQTHMTSEYVQTHRTSVHGLVCKCYLTKNHKNHKESRPNHDLPDFIYICHRSGGCIVTVGK